MLDELDSYADMQVATGRRQDNVAVGDASPIALVPHGWDLVTGGPADDGALCVFMPVQ